MRNSVNLTLLAIVMIILSAVPANADDLSKTTCKHVDGADLPETCKPIAAVARIFDSQFFPEPEFGAAIYVMQPDTVLIRARILSEPPYPWLYRVIGPVPNHRCMYRMADVDKTTFDELYEKFDSPPPGDQPPIRYGGSIVGMIDFNLLSDEYRVLPATQWSSPRMVVVGKGDAVCFFSAQHGSCQQELSFPVVMESIATRSARALRYIFANACQPKALPF